MGNGDFIGGVLLGAAASAAAILLLGPSGGRRAETVSVELEPGRALAGSGQRDRSGRGAVPDGGLAAPSRQAIQRPPASAGNVGSEKALETGPGGAGALAKWDPVQAYRALVERPVPDPFPWRHVARGLEAVQRPDLAAEAWWTSLRLDPVDGDALAALEALEPGGPVRRMEQELRRLGGFPERNSMVSYLVPHWIASGRLEAGAACIDLDGVLKRMNHPRFPRTYARPDQVPWLHLLIAARPLEAEQAIAGLLDRHRPAYAEGEVLRALLRELRGEVQPPADEHEEEPWSSADRDALFAEEWVDADSLESLLASLPDSTEFIERLGERTLADVGADPLLRAENLVELGRFYARRGERARARDLVDAALETEPIEAAWELRRKLELGRPAEDI